MFKFFMMFLWVYEIFDFEAMIGFNLSLTNCIKSRVHQVLVRYSQKFMFLGLSLLKILIGFRHSG